MCCSKVGSNKEGNIPQANIKSANAPKSEYRVMRTGLRQRKEYFWSSDVAVDLGSSTPTLGCWGFLITDSGRGLCVTTRTFSHCNRAR